MGGDDSRPLGSIGSMAPQLHPLFEAVRLHIRDGRLPQAKAAADRLLAAEACPDAVRLARALARAPGGVEGCLVLGMALREQKRLVDSE
jgi:hypothetical protein